jgi:membrane protein
MKNSGFRELRDTFVQVGREWSADRVPRLAAALAYYALFSLAPLLVVALGVAGFFLGAEAARGELVAQFRSLIGVPGAMAVENLLASTGSPGKGVIAAILGFATLLLGASGVFGELQGAMNSIWNVKPKPGAGWKIFLRRRFLSFAMVLGSGFLLLVSLVMTAALSAAGRYLTTVAPSVELLWSTLNGILGLFLPATLFALIFRLIPDAKVPWRDAWTGALFTAALFALGRAAIGYYLGRGAIDSTYGAAASLVAVVLWVYYSAQILFLGAELTQVLEKRRTAQSHKPRPGADKVVEITRRVPGPSSRRSPVRRRSETPRGAAAALAGILLWIYAAVRRQPGARRARHPIRS